MDRRKFLKEGVKLGVVAVAGFGLHSAVAGRKEPVKLPLPYVKLDPEKVAERAYRYYKKHHCCYGVFASILDELKERVGGPYLGIPSEMMAYGSGGAGGWGTLCGTLNGASAIFCLTAKDYKNLIDALYDWYQKTALPIYVPKGKKAFPKSVAHSPLCHISVQRWCASATKFFKTPVLYNSKKRSERCARLTADVARKAVELLNDYHFKLVVPAKVKGSEKTKMECNICHEISKKT
jgi:hypothetical protein